MAITRPLLVCAILCLAFALPERFNIEEEMAPKSFSNQYYRYPSLTSSTMENFHEETLDFDEITPTLVFGYGTGYQQKEKMVKWNELKNSFTKKGKLNFSDLVSDFPGFKRAKKLVVISHGWSDGKVDSCDEAWVSKMGRTIRENDLNVATIALCWNSKFWTQIKLTEIFGKSSKQSGVGKLCLASFGPFSKIYFTHAATTGKVGEFLASILKSIKRNNKKIFIHGIGHSLGAHIMGNIFNFGGLKLDRISGLDPAGPCFEGKLGDIRLPEKVLTKWGLNADAAEFVDNYHTDGKNYGTYSSMGDMDFFIGEIDENGVSDVRSQPTCFTCTAGCCHNIVRAYFTESILQKGHFQIAYPSNFEAVKLNGTSWIHKRKQREKSKMYAGYHAEKPSYFSKNKRMFLPMFNNKYDEDKWAAVCDLENLGEREKGYCVAQGSKMISSSTGRTHSTHSTTHSSQALHTTSSIRPGTTRSTFWIGSAATTRSTPTTTATTISTTSRSTFWIGSAATTHSTPTTTATTTSTTTRSTFWIASTATTRSTPTTTATTTTTITTTTRSTFWIASAATTHSTPSTTATTTTHSRNLTEGNYTSSDGRITVHYREEQARSKERKVSFRCENDVVKSCFVNKDTYKIWGKGYTQHKADYYSALAKNYADSKCDSKAVFGPDYCLWDRKQQC